MSKISLSEVFTIAGINTNFQLIVDELNNKVYYRNNPSGEPNALITTDTDYNGNNIMNANQIKASRLFLNGVEVQPSALALSLALKIANNLSDVQSASASRANLGLGNVDNTSDVNKPISTATQTALNLKAPLAAPAFTGVATFAVRPTFAGNTPWDNGNLASPASTTATLAQFAPTTSAQLAALLTDETGSGANVFGTNPTISGATTTGGTINNTPIGGTTPNTGAFTTLSTTSGATIGNGLTVTAGGSTINGGLVVAGGAITPVSTAGIVGTNTNNNATAGAYGEYVTNSGAGVALTTATPANATSVSLTAGDWDVSGSVQFVPAGTTTVSAIAAGVSTTSATLGALGSFNSLSATLTTGAGQIISTPTFRISLSATTTVYIVAQMTFGVSTATCGGFIRARRVR